jgi:SAM-dependent methyltransferase
MAGNEWFKEWFNSPYYHVLYANRNEQEAEDFIKKITEHLHIPPNAKVLDVACGKGRHSKTLAKLGFDVTGIDLSCNNINEAKQFTCPTLHFDVWDMRSVYRNNEFDVVFNLFSSFGYFDDEKDDFAAIKAMHSNLKPNGVLVLDYLNTEWAVKHIKPREIVPRGEFQFHITKRIERGFIKKKIDFLAEGENHSYEEQLKVINRLKFEEMLLSAGFTLRETFGNYDLAPFHSSSSPRLILIADKRD